MIEVPLNILCQNFYRINRICHQYKASTTHFSSDSVPKNVKEALSDPRWKEAINEEMKALSKNETWDIIDLPKEKNQWDTSGVYYKIQT